MHTWRTLGPERTAKVVNASLISEYPTSAVGSLLPYSNPTTNDNKNEPTTDENGQAGWSRFALAGIGRAQAESERELTVYRIRRPRGGATAGLCYPSTECAGGWSLVAGKFYLISN